MHPSDVLGPKEDAPETPESLRDQLSLITKLKDRVRTLEEEIRMLETKKDAMLEAEQLTVKQSSAVNRAASLSAELLLRARRVRREIKELLERRQRLAFDRRVPSEDPIILGQRKERHRLSLEIRDAEKRLAVLLAAEWEAAKRSKMHA